MKCVFEKYRVHRAAASKSGWRIPHIILSVQFGRGKASTSLGRTSLREIHEAELHQSHLERRRAGPHCVVMWEGLEANAHEPVHCARSTAIRRLKHPVQHPYTTDTSSYGMRHFVVRICSRW